MRNAFSLRRVLLFLSLQSVVLAEIDPPQEKTNDQEQVPNNYCPLTDTYSKIWETTEHTESNFVVGGVNLGSYGRKDSEEAFELFQDFDIGPRVTGTETWKELIAYRSHKQSASLSFYVDKVAQKRYLPTIGIPIPQVYGLKYAHELSKTGDEKEEYEAILQLFPMQLNVCAKPTHLAVTQGVWLLGQEDNHTTMYSSRLGERLEPDETTQPTQVAASLVRNLHKLPHDFDSITYDYVNIQPGVVVEERYTDLYDVWATPLEFNLFTIWGRVWVAQWGFANKEGRFYKGFLRRNGTMPLDTPGTPADLPDFVDWPKLVEMAEVLGAHKDMFRTDIMVGLPWSSLQPEDTVEDRLAKMRTVVSECEIYPTTEFYTNKLPEEGARLWIAGYKMGNYRVVKNTEVPAEFLERGYLSASN